MSNWVICASGPSMARVDLAHLRRFRSWRVLTVNTTFRLVPWADALFAGDWAWWQAYGDEVRRTFRGETWTRDSRARARYGVNMVRGIGGDGLCRKPGTIHLGGNSGYQAINLAWHWGARRIVLLGFDFHRKAGAHWHGDHPAGMVNAPHQHMAGWIDAMRDMAKDLSREGVDVVNATPGSAIPWFRQAAMGEALRADRHHAGAERGTDPRGHAASLPVAGRRRAAVRRLLDGSHRGDRVEL